MTYSFAHISDCHVGAWRNQILRDLNIRAFEKAMEKCIEKKVDFIVISGDLFDVNIPDLLSVKRAASKMREVKANNIPIYVIYGSHDYSATAVSIVDVLQSTGLFEKVVDAKYDDDRLVLNFYRD
ncbi:MAG: metallophosphoesterase, partial [Candidatus Methylarchaceae archaeon HK01M]|nr:metallophosphoesterase [Candidatus Methylarchaceae archaeon HK01M]